MTIHIRRCTANSVAWAAETDTGHLIGTDHSLDNLVSRVAGSETREAILHIEPAEATRRIEGYIEEQKREIARAQETIRNGKRILKSYHSEREAIRERLGID